MISPALLDALREKDPELWKIATRTELATIEYCDADGDECEPDYIYWSGLRSEAQEAWILYCLMQAIRARGWGYTLEDTGGVWIEAWVSMPNPERTISFKGDTEAEALGWAYLSALGSPDF